MHLLYLLAVQPSVITKRSPGAMRAGSTKDDG